jgi:hypothetical protein
MRVLVAFCRTAVRVGWWQWHVSFHAISNLLPQNNYLKKKFTYEIDFKLINKKINRWRLSQFG